jgi:hypothetical protein
LQAISQQLQAPYAVEPTHADRSVLTLVRNCCSSSSSGGQRATLDVYKRVEEHDDILFPARQVILTSMHMLLTAGARLTITQILAQLSFDWACFTARVYAHGITPLMAVHLQKLGVVDYLPPHVRAVLQNAYYRTGVTQER